MPVQHVQRSVLLSAGGHWTSWHTTPGLSRRRRPSLIHKKFPRCQNAELVAQLSFGGAAARKAKEDELKAAKDELNRQEEKKKSLAAADANPREDSGYV